MINRVFMASHARLISNTNVDTSTTLMTLIDIGHMLPCANMAMQSSI